MERRVDNCSVMYHNGLNDWDDIDNRSAQGLNFIEPDVQVFREEKYKPSSRPAETILIY